MADQAGRFIVIEGADGAGKSTLAARLVERMSAAGYDVLAVREPGGTPVAEAARAIFLDPAMDASDRAELFLVLAARADLVDKVIRPALAAGRNVVSDRFSLSTIAYQVVGRGLPEASVLAAIDLATGGLAPDLTVVLDVPAELGRRRQELAGKVPDRLERAGAELHEQVAGFFAGLTGQGIFHVDASGDADQVLRSVWALVARFLQQGE